MSGNSASSVVSGEQASRLRAFGVPAALVLGGVVCALLLVLGNAHDTWVIVVAALGVAAAVGGVVFLDLRRRAVEALTAAAASRTRELHSLAVLLDDVRQEVTSSVEQLFPPSMSGAAPYDPAVNGLRIGVHLRLGPEPSTVVESFEALVEGLNLSADRRAERTLRRSGQFRDALELESAIGRVDHALSSLHDYLISQEIQLRPDANWAERRTPTPDGQPRRPDHGAGSP